MEGAECPETREARCSPGLWVPCARSLVTQLPLFLRLPRVHFLCVHSRGTPGAPVRLHLPPPAGSGHITEQGRTPQQEWDTSTLTTLSTASVGGHQLWQATWLSVSGELGPRHITAGTECDLIPDGGWQRRTRRVSCWCSSDRRSTGSPREMRRMQSCACIIKKSKKEKKHVLHQNKFIFLFHFCSSIMKYACGIALLPTPRARVTEPCCRLSWERAELAVSASYCRSKTSAFPCRVASGRLSCDPGIYGSRC